MASSVSLNNAAVAALADKIAQARKVYGRDSSYAIGVFAGLEMLLVGEDGAAVCRQLQDRVLELETGKAAPAPKPPPEQSKSQGQAVSLAENEWIRGAVKWFNNDKGYGFISTESDTDVFVHWRDISSWDRSLTQGDEVEFMVTKTAKGFQAINVMKSDQTSQGDGKAGEIEGAPGPGMDTTGEDSEASPASDVDPDSAPAASQETATEERAPAETATAPPMGEEGGDPSAATSPEATAGTAADGAETATPPTAS